MNAPRQDLSGTADTRDDETRFHRELSSPLPVLGESVRMRMRDGVLHAAPAPTLESLESRRLFDGSAALVGTILTVQGTGNADTIVMGHNISGFYFVNINQQPSQLFSPQVVTAIVINAGQGNDSIDVSALPAGAPGVEVHGGQGDDTVIGSANNDSLYGGQGNDSIGGGAGDDWISGGAGQNTLRGGAGNDSITAGNGSTSSTAARATTPFSPPTTTPTASTAAPATTSPTSTPTNLDTVVNATQIPPS